MYRDPKGRARCWWFEGEAPDKRMLAYHDKEWGTAVHGDTELFERLSLEAFQAGLSWSTILNKREAFDAAFREFDPKVVATFDADDRARLMADAGIVRNGAKIDATIGNARVALAIVSEFGSLDAYFHAFAPGPPQPVGPRTRPGMLPDSTEEAEKISADLKKRGMRFVGPTVVYAFMQSVGLVDDHLPGCYRYRG